MKTRFRTLTDHSGLFWAMIATNVVFLALGLAAALFMESHGHIVTGMSNSIVWGLPHVFAVFLVVSASGALNVASISSVFNRLAYKPYARLSGVLAVALLAGGLSVLVLDLGRPERVFIAMTHNNFRSIFAWNIYLYSGFVAIVATYLFSMMDRGASRSAAFGKGVAWTAFVWRLALTTGTGSIFGFLIAREAYDAAIMAPLFIAASFLYGLSFTVAVLLTMTRETREELMDGEMISKFSGLFLIFSLTVLFLTAIQYLTKFYSLAHRDVVLFLLWNGGVFPLVFWIGQIVVGTLLPIAMLMHSRTRERSPAALMLVSVLFLFGGLCQFYVIIIGGQAWPLDIFPGLVASSSFGDGAVAQYFPTVPEALLGISGVALAMLLVALAIRILPFVPVVRPSAPTGTPA